MFSCDTKSPISFGVLQLIHNECESFCEVFITLKKSTKKSFEFWISNEKEATESVKRQVTCKNHLMDIGSKKGVDIKCYRNRVVSASK